MGRAGRVRQSRGQGRDNDNDNDNDNGNDNDGRGPGYSRQLSSVWRGQIGDLS